MRKIIRPEIRDLLEGVEYASDRLQDGFVEEAEQVLRALHGKARKLGIGHSTILHQLALVCLLQDRAEEALELMIEAIAQEPVSLHLQKGYSAVIGRMHELIEDEEIKADDPRIPRYHAVLAREGEATVETHLALSRYLAAVGAAEELTRLGRALTMLHPGHPEVERLRADLLVQELASEEGSGAELKLIANKPAKA